MYDNVFISSGCFGRNLTLREILTLSLQGGFPNVELGSTASYSLDILKELSETVVNGTHCLLLHNYFPPPIEPFVLNLASNDECILRASIEHCQTAISWCARLGIPLFTVHSGFSFHAKPEHLGMKQTQLQRFSLTEAYEIFVRSISKLNQLAKDLGVRLAVENNPVAAMNCDNGYNNLYLGVTSEDFTALFNDIPDENLGLLVDVGHLKVSAKSLGFDPIKFIWIFRERIFAYHLNDNDGLTDLHNEVTEGSWFWPVIRDLSADTDQQVLYILETGPRSLNVIANQYRLVGRKLVDG